LDRSVDRTNASSFDFVYPGLAGIVGIISICRSTRISRTGIYDNTRKDRLLFSVGLFFSTVLFYAVVLVLFRSIGDVPVVLTRSGHYITMQIAQFLDIVLFAGICFIAVFSAFHSGIGPIISASLAFFISTFARQQIVSSYYKEIPFGIIVILLSLHCIVPVFIYAGIPYFLAHNSTKRLSLCLLLSSVLSSLIYTSTSNALAYLPFPDIRITFPLLLAGMPLHLALLLIVSALFTFIYWLRVRKQSRKEQHCTEA